MPTNLLVLMAHGSRDPRWRAPFETLLEQLRQEQGALQPIALCYMEMAEPTLRQVVQEALHQNPALTTVKILPLLMAAGAHFANDIKALTLDLRHQHPQLSVLVAPPVGEHPQVQAALKYVVEEASQQLSVSAF
jgi:sirohydrochlorin cobaltochelatase